MRLAPALRPIGFGILLGTFGPVRPAVVGAVAHPNLSAGQANSLAGEVHSLRGFAAAEEKKADDEALRLLSQAEGLLRLGRPDAAAAIARALPTDGPHGFAALRVRAWALLCSSGYGELTELLAGQDGLHGELLYLRGAARLRGGGSDVETGCRDLEQVWWQEPEGVWGMAALRELADVEGLYGVAARRVIRRNVPRGTPRDTSAAAADAQQAVAATLDRLGKHAPPRSRLQAEIHRAIGMRLVRREEFAAAVAAFNRALGLARDPQLRRAIRLGLGEAQRRRGNIRAATASFDAVAGGADDALAQSANARAGQMFIEYRRYDQARRRFESQLVQNPVGRSRQQALWGLGWVAFRTGRFAEARRFFATLQHEAPFGERAPAAIYWAARAVEESGAIGQARAELAALVERFPVSYYAYRARGRLGRRPWPSTENALPPMQIGERARHILALLAAGMERRAKASLRDVLAAGRETMGPVALDRLIDVAYRLRTPYLAAKLRYQRNRRFPDGSRGTIAPLARQFPEAMVALVRREAQSQHVDPELVIALVRQESGFNARAMSSVGALGLMQLMPETARGLLREQNRHAHPTTAQILAPATNLRLGVRYLGRMLRAFRGSVEVTLAAYNAGPGAVTRWRQGRGDLPADIFVEEIPYRETNRYVRRVLAWRQALRLIQRAGNTPTPPPRLVAARD